MTRVFIRYENSVVSIDTSFGRGLLKDMPMEIVGDLIDACISNPNVKGQLGINQLDFGPFTLHSLNNQTPYDPWDSLTILGNNGKTGRNPLIIRSLNDQGIYFLICS